MFCLFYDAKTKKVHALNGSGRTSANVSLEKIRVALNLAEGQRGGVPMDSVHAITVPGAAAGWVDTHAKFGSGRLSLEQVLAPAIELAEQGFPVSELTSGYVGLSDLDKLRSLTDLYSGKRLKNVSAKHPHTFASCSRSTPRRKTESGPHVPVRFTKIPPLHRRSGRLQKKGKTDSTKAASRRPSSRWPWILEASSHWMTSSTTLRAATKMSRPFP